MKKSIYSIFDTVAQVFNNPFTSINDATAVREFTAASEQQTHINDLTLYKLGDINDHTGEITKTENPIKLITGFEINQNQKEVQADIAQ